MGEALDSNNSCKVQALPAHSKRPLCHWPCCARKHFTFLGGSFRLLILILILISIRMNRLFDHEKLIRKPA